MLTFHRPKASDIVHVARHLRSEDILEVAASHAHIPILAVSWAVTSSTFCRVARWDDEPVALFGYARHLEGPVSVWLLGTATLAAHHVRRSFLKASRAFTAQWVNEFGTLFNYVDAKASTSRRWLRWLGFVEYPLTPYGPATLPFIPIVKTHV